MGNIEVVWKNSKPISKKKKEKIERIWQQTLKKKKLQNNPLLSFLDIKINKIIQISGEYVEYKQFIAQKEKPNLKMGITPIGVSGIIILKDRNKEYVLFGKRSENNALYPGLLELVPSGSIDKKFALPGGKVDYKSQILKEYEEETNLSKNIVDNIEEFAIVFDKKNKIYDICCQIYLNADRKDIKRQLADSEEYKSFVFVELNNLKDYLKTNLEKIVYTSEAIIEIYIKNKL